MKKHILPAALLIITISLAITCKSPKATITNKATNSQIVQTTQDTIWQITAEQLESLEPALPAETYKQLSAMQDRQYTTKQAYITAVEQQIGAEKMKYYGKAIAATALNNFQITEKRAATNNDDTIYAKNGENINFKLGQTVVFNDYVITYKSKTPNQKFAEDSIDRSYCVIRNHHNDIVAYTKFDYLPNWERAKMQTIHFVEGDSISVECCPRTAISDDGQRIIQYGNFDGPERLSPSQLYKYEFFNVYVYNRKGELLNKIERRYHNKKTNDFEYSKNGSFVIFGYYYYKNLMDSYDTNEIIDMFDKNGNQIFSQPTYGTCYNDICISDDGKFLAYVYNLNWKSENPTYTLMVVNHYGRTIYDMESQARTKVEKFLMNDKYLVYWSNGLNLLNLETNVSIKLPGWSKLSTNFDMTDESVLVSYDKTRAYRTDINDNPNIFNNNYLTIYNTKNSEHCNLNFGISKFSESNHLVKKTNTEYIFSDPYFNHAFEVMHK